MADKLDAQKILHRLAVSEDRYPNVYWIGRKAKWLTFHAQQRRALNLIWALHNDPHEARRLQPGDKVTVVGAGLAGITAAYTAWQMGANVTVYEKQHEVLHLQRGCRQRLVHPTIIDWPIARWTPDGTDAATDPPRLRASTDLPCLNWGAGTADQVCETILEQWEPIEKQIGNGMKFQVKVTRVQEPDDGRPVIRAVGEFNQEFQDTCQFLILAVGFGLEKEVKEVPWLSYWHNDNLDRPVLGRQTGRRYLVTGCGDGGLIDFARLAIRGFDHAEFVYQVTQSSGIEEVEAKLRAAEAQVEATMEQDFATIKEVWRAGVKRLDLAQGANESDFDEETIRKDAEALEIEKAYRDLPVSPAVRDAIVGKMRRDTEIVLNDSRILPWSLKSSILSRYVAWVLLNRGVQDGGKFIYRPGRATIARVLNDSRGLYQVEFARGLKSPPPVLVGEVVVRHGPDSEIKKLFEHDPDVVRACEWLPGDEVDWTQMDPAPDLLAQRRLRADDLPRVRASHAFANASLAARVHFNAGTHDRFAVDFDGDSTKYVIRTAQPLHAFRFSPPEAVTHAGNRKRIFDIPVKFEYAPHSPWGRIKVIVRKLGLPRWFRRGEANLLPGDLIWNQSMVTAVSVESDDAAVPTPGTLGCVVRLPDDQYALLTTASALGSPWALNKDDVIHRIGKDGPLVGAPVARITHIDVPVPTVPSASRPAGTIEFNRAHKVADAVLATLEPSVGFGPGFPGHLGVPASADDRRVPPDGLLGVEVEMHGAASGVTTGKVIGIDATAEVADLDPRYWYEGVLAIKGNGDEPFARPGDAGAAVVRKDDKTLVGLVLGTTDATTFACPIGPILRKYRCEPVAVAGKQPLRVPITPEQ